MPRNGSGTFTRTDGVYTGSQVWQNERDANVKIRADRSDTHDQDIADAITGSLAKDGQTTPTANLPMGGYRHTGVGAASARNHYADVGAVQDSSFTWCGTAAGTQNALTFSPTPAITAYATGQTFVGIIGASSTNSTATLAVSGLTAKDIQVNGAALSSSVVLETGKIYSFVYDGTRFQATRLSPNQVVSASETASGIVELATDAETSTGTDTARAVTPANVASAYVGQGMHTIFVPAAAMRPTTSNGCAQLAATETTAGRPDLIGLAFDTSNDEHAQFQVAMPKSWNEGTVTFRVYWWSTAADTDGVAWGLQGVACADGDTADVAYGTPIVVTDAAQSTSEDVYITAISSAVTIDGSPAAGELCFFRVFRDVSDAADTAAEDCILLGLDILFTINARTDA